MISHSRTLSIVVAYRHGLESSRNSLEDTDGRRRLANVEQESNQSTEDYGQTITSDTEVE
jgi:hypothetical protein